MNLSNLASLFLANWISVVEDNPNLRAVEIVEALFFEVTGTENRIAFERLRYNDAVRVFNTAVLSVPNNLIAGMFGFQQRPFFDPIPGGP
jgi:LemA protein